MGQIVENKRGNMSSGIVPFNNYLVKIVIDNVDLTVYSWENIQSKYKKILFLIKDNNLLVFQNGFVYQYIFDNDITIFGLYNLTHEILYYRNQNIRISGMEHWDENTAKGTILYYHEHVMKKMSEEKRGRFTYLWDMKTRMIKNAIVTFHSWDIYLQRENSFFIEFFGPKIFTIFHHAGHPIYLKSIVHMNAIKLIHNQIIVQI